MSHSTELSTQIIKLKFCSVRILMVLFKNNNAVNLRRTRLLGSYINKFPPRSPLLVIAKYIEHKTILKI